MNTNRGSQLLLGSALGSALVLTLCVSANAADIYEAPPQPVYEAPPPPPLDRGIYIKGYLGQANPEVGSMFNEVYDTNTFTVYNNDIKSSPLWGFGIGYQRSHWLRFDLTGEYRGDAIFVGNDTYADPPGIATAGTNEFTADIKSWLGLANAYWDIGTWCGFRPYLGAGIGFASVTVEGLKDVNVPQRSFFFAADHTETNFAWALHAGVSFDVTEQFVVDLAYRYADLGDARSGVVTAYDGTSSYSGHHIKDITSNDLLLGFRYKLQDAAPVYAVK